MHIALLNNQQKDMFYFALQRAMAHGDTFQLAFDPLDNTLKFKVAEFSWSPPVATEER